MGAFAELDWSRIDVWAIVASGGVATIDERRRDRCLAWLRRQGYGIESIDCAGGLDVAIPELGRLLRWEDEFGYSLRAQNRNLNALRDGFDFDVPAGGGKVFELVRADVAWKEDPHWLLGLLSIAQEASRRELALGRRFFCLLVVPEHSALIGQTIDVTTVPAAFWSPSPVAHEFERD